MKLFLVVTDKYYIDLVLVGGQVPRNVCYQRPRGRWENWSALEAVPDEYRDIILAKLRSLGVPL